MPLTKHKLNKLSVMLIDKPNPNTPKGISRISPKTILLSLSKLKISIVMISLF